MHEPDNEKEHLSALVAKRDLGRFPALFPGDHRAEYEHLWRLAFTGVDPDTESWRRRMAFRLWRRESPEARERSVRGQLSHRTRMAVASAGPLRAVAVPAAPTRSVVVKTVHSALSLDWLADTFRDVRIVLVLRHPANVLSSWREMGLPDQDRAIGDDPTARAKYLLRWQVKPPPSGASDLDRAAWQVCFLTAALVEAVASRPEIVVLSHEEMCADPVREFSALAQALRLGWSEDAERFLVESDRPGSGFTLQRRALEQPQRWRTRLGADGVRALQLAADRFPGLERWRDEIRDQAQAGSG